MFGFSSNDNVVPDAMNPRYSSILQFSLRRSFVALAVLSVVFAVTVPAIRMLSPVRQQIALLFLGTAIATLVAVISAMAWLRYKAERKCGRVLHVVILHLPPAARLMPFMMVVNMGGMLMLALTLAPSASRPNAGVSSVARVFLYVFPVFAGFHLAPAILRLWCGPRVVGIELCEHGIVDGIGFSPWSAIRRFHWNASGLLVVQHRFSRQELPVDPADHDIVDQIFREHVGTKVEGYQLQ